MFLLRRDPQRREVGQPRHGAADSGPDDEERREVPVPALEPIVDNVAHFADCVATGARPETGGPEGLAVVRIMEAMARSAEDGGAPVLLADV